MKVRLIPFRDAPVTPWANGGGRTRELLAWPEVGPWRLRVSVADIEADGPFSSFPGVQRWFAVVQGGAIALTVDGTERVCEPGGEAATFAGDAKVEGRRLGGDSRDLNLMVRRGRGAMRRARDGEAWQPQASRWGLYAVDAAVCTFGDVRAELPPETLLWVEGEARAASARSLDEGAGLVAWWLAVDLPDDPEASA